MTDPTRISLFDRSWFIRLVRVAAVILLAGLALAVYFNARPNVPQDADYPLFYAGANSYLSGESIYRKFLYAPILQRIVFLEGPEGLAAGRLSENLNPPVVTFLSLPFALLDLRVSYYVWCLVQVGLALLLLWRILDHLPGSHPLRRPAAALVLAVYFPVFANLLIGQLGLFVFAALALHWLALERGQERWAGCWLGVALLLKLFTGLIFIWFLLQRRWTILWWGALVWVLGMFAALLVFGTGDHFLWLQVLGQHHGGALSWNASLEGMLERYFGAGLLPSLFPSPWICWALRSLAVSLTAAALIWLARQQPALGRDFTGQLGLALCLPLMLLLAPLGWIYYFPVLFISMVVVWRVGTGTERRGPGPVLGGLALLAGGIPQLLSADSNFRPQLWRAYYVDGWLDRSGTETIYRYDDVYHWFVVPELYTLALILMALAVLCTAHRSRTRAP